MTLGYCYQTLIHYSLFKAGVKNEDIDTYINFLTEFSYMLVRSDSEGMNVKTFNEFYAKYSSRFICPPVEIIVEKLKRAKIMTYDEDYRFSYNYILYYMSAKKISEILNTVDGKEIVNKLFSQLDNERNANILVFITHHSKDVTFIEESLLNSMLVLEQNIPITLNRDDPYYEDIKEIAEYLQNDILDPEKNPKQVRDEILQNKDAAENQRSNHSPSENNSNKLNEIIKPLIHSLRSIEIIGQIIKNRKGSLEIPRLVELVTEVYSTAFRSISYYSELLGSMTEDIKMMMDEDLDLKDGKNEILRRILLFLQMVSFKFCLSVLTKLTYSVGTHELATIYRDVAEKLDTPVSKLVTFWIKSYHGTISVNEVKTMMDEFNDNIVATRILRTIVRSYVYNRNLPFDLKQKFASAGKMRLTQQRRVKL